MGCDLLHHFHDRDHQERLATGQELVEDDAQAGCRSDRAWTPVDSPLACSGLMYAGVPAPMPRAFAEILVSERKTEVGDTRFTRGVDQDVGSA